MVVTGTGVTVNAVHPGIVDTEIIRHMSFFNSTFSAIFLKPLVWMFIKSPRHGAQTTVYAALDDSIKNVTGKYFVWVLECGDIITNIFISNFLENCIEALTERTAGWVSAWEMVQKLKIEALMVLCTVKTSFVFFSFITTNGREDKGWLTPVQRVALGTHRKFVRACGASRQKSAVSKWIGLFP